MSDMTDDSGVPQQTPEPDALDKLTVDEALDNLGLDGVKEILKKRFEDIGRGKGEIEEELLELKKAFNKRDEAILKRIEKLMMLMSTHMAFLRQMIDLLDSYGDKLNQLEKNSSKYKLEHAIVVDRMNQMVRCFGHLEQNMKDIVEGFDDLRAKVDDIDKTKFQVITVAIIGGIVCLWLLKGGDLGRLITFFQNVLK